MKKLFQIALLFLLSFTAQKSYATHVSGGEITYTEVSPKIYEVSYVFYRNCAGIPLDTSATGSNRIFTRLRCSSGGTLSLSGIALQSIEKIPFHCDTGVASCGTPNQIRSGDGVERFVLTMTLNFNLSPLSSFASCSGDIILEMNNTVRSASITTGPSGAFYCRATLKDINNTLLDIF